MSRKRVFVDGSSGTTGLRIRERLAGREDLELVLLPEELRKDPSARRDALCSAEIAFLCLPDAAAQEAAELAEESDTVLIDTSTAHRVSPGWTYGFPELKGQREKIIASKRISNPGCHASGFIALIAPLQEAGLLSPDVALSAFSLTGYTGGGKKMIGEYEDPGRSPLLGAPRMYGLGQSHKHLPEMQKYCGLFKTPIFCPIVADFPTGMEVVVPVFRESLKGTKENVVNLYRSYYQSGLIRYCEDADEGGFLSAGGLSGRDDMEIAVFGNEDRILLVSRFDNLGKGASGAAIQNLNLVLGLEENTGLSLEK